MRDALYDVHRALFDRPLTSAPLLELASRTIPESMRAPSSIIHATRPGALVDPSEPVQAMAAVHPVDVTIRAVTRAPSTPRRLAPLWFGGGIAMLAVAALVSLRHRTDLPTTATVQSQEPAATGPHAVPGSTDVGSAAPPPTGAVTVSPPPSCLPEPPTRPRLGGPRSSLDHRNGLDARLSPTSARRSWHGLGDAVRPHSE